MAMHDIHSDWHAETGRARPTGEGVALGAVAVLVVLLISLALYGASTGVSLDMTGATGTNDWHGNVAASGWAR
ncbi:MAG: hypothetical protein NXH97_00410 [Rhodobacteraceae bacterium]|nr:hypothetical protein [Paracoccaceae bacterium]